jgi:CheY-like chemotaxis protein
VTVAKTDAPLARARCLVLDDEFLIALDIQQILEAAGAASVICVASADEALALLRDGVGFDIAVLDLKLSGETPTSLSVAAELSRRKTPFVFLTGMRETDENLRKFPQAPVVEKPYQAPRLLETVRGALIKT